MCDKSCISTIHQTLDPMKYHTCCCDFEGMGGILAFCASFLEPVAAAAGPLGTAPVWEPLACPWEVPAGDAWGSPHEANAVEEDEGHADAAG